MNILTFNLFNSKFITHNSKLSSVRGFTLIERVPRLTLGETCRLKRNDPANCPFQAGSQTAERTRSAATNSPEGKPVKTQGTRSQSVWGGESSGRRQTKDRRHRKGDLAVIADRARYFGRRSSVLWEKSAIIGVENGYEHPMTRRCKRSRHELIVSSGNWGGPARFRYLEISDGITRNAESRGKALWGVGDAHSSDDGERSITPPERRGISRSVFLVKGVDPHECPKD